MYINFWYVAAESSDIKFGAEKPLKVMMLGHNFALWRDKKGAVRCISGGIPPGLLVRDRNGNLQAVLLAGADGRELPREILDYVAESVRVRGTLVRSAGFLILRADPFKITRE